MERPKSYSAEYENFTGIFYYADEAEAYFDFLESSLASQKQEIERLKNLIRESAPVMWVRAEYLEQAREWEIKATEALKEKGEGDGKI